METKELDQAKVAVIGPRFDTCSAAEVELALKNLIASGASEILVDFSQTEYISSAGFGVLLAAAKRLQNLGGGLVLCSIKPDVQRLFETAGFTHIFKICDSREDALRLVANTGDRCSGS